MRHDCLLAHKDRHPPVTEPRLGHLEAGEERKPEAGGEGGRSGAEPHSLKTSQLLGSESQPLKSKVPFASLLSALKKKKENLLQVSTVTGRAQSGCFLGAWTQVGQRHRLLRNPGQGP